MTRDRALRVALRSLRRGDPFEAIGRRLGPEGPRAVLIAQEILKGRRAT